jgi:hypothetical protein
MNMPSLREAIEHIGLSGRFGWRENLSSLRPSSVRELIDACRPPQLAEWSNPERSRVENADWTEEINGIVTDGHGWYVSCNADDDREGLYKLTTSFKVIKKLPHPFDEDDVHMGALCVRNGVLYVPMQYGRWGVWAVDTEFASSRFVAAEERPEDDMFPWCDVHPRNGLLYTSNFSDPTHLWAYDCVGSQLLRHCKHDIPLIQPSDGKPTTRVQGACFMPKYKWLAVCDVDGSERIHCHSALTGAFLDRRFLLADTDEGSVGERNEIESIWFFPYRTGQGDLVHVHVVELNNEHHTADDMYLWHFALPDPSVL